MKSHEFSLAAVVLTVALSAGFGGGMRAPASPGAFALARQAVQHAARTAAWGAGN